MTRRSQFFSYKQMALSGGTCRDGTKEEIHPTCAALRSDLLSNGRNTACPWGTESSRHVK